MNRRQAIASFFCAVLGPAALAAAAQQNVKADLSSEQAKIATEDANSFAPPFDVVVFEQLS